MNEVPKIVCDRLRAALPEQAHPDADLLAAFVEQALSATERDGVLQHLARCGDCREVVALALPSAEMAQPQTAPQTVDEAGVRTAAWRTRAHKLSLAWPTLRWAALAAGVAVAAAVLLLHPGKLNQATVPSAKQQTATTAPPASGPQIASSSAPSTSVPSPPVPSSSTSEPEVMAKTYGARPKSESTLSWKLRSGLVVTPSPQTESGMLLADNKKDSGQADKLSAAPSDGAQALDYDTRTSRAATETVEDSGAAAAPATRASVENALMARNETSRNGAPAIEKAKPAPQEMQVNNSEVNDRKASNSDEQKAQAPAVPGIARPQASKEMSTARLASTASPTPAHNVAWTITGGILQRSLDSGQSWQNALHADHPLLCYASHDADVWTGGQAGILFHSANGGVTWVKVRPAHKTRQLSADITHIEVRGEVRGERDDVRSPSEILLSTSNNEIWSSADGGKTWAKK